MDLAADDSLLFLKRFHEERPEGTSFILAVRDPNRDVSVEPHLVSATVTKPLEIDTLAEIVRECALVVPRPVDPLPCPPAESDFRLRLDDSGAFYN